MNMLLGALITKIFFVGNVMKGQVLETIVGTFVLVIACWFLFSVTQKSGEVFPKGNEIAYQASFFDISGIKTGSQVRIAGVIVGRVINIDLDTKNFSADIAVAIDNEIQIPEDSEIIITSEGLLGSNFVSITPGGSEKYLKPNDKFVYTQGAVNLNNLLQKLSGG